METAQNLLFNTSAFIIILSIIVFIHEFGHYYIAKLSGVKIETFSIGFGKELFGWNDKSGTRWKISLIPMGGYVKMFGDADPSSSPDNDKISQFSEEDKKIAFHTKPLYKKAAIVAAGPLANFLLAIVIIAFFFSYYGKPTTLSKVSLVSAESAAFEAGIKAGDDIIYIDDSKIDTFSDVQRIISINTGTAINITLKRNNEIIETTATPRMHERKDIFGNDIQTPLLGISSTEVSYEKENIFKAVVSATIETYKISGSTLKAIGQMITGERSVKEISGPIGIAKYSGQSAKRGITTVLWFMAIISINLGLVNLFPIPVLDGGHLLYYTIEAATGKPVADKVQEIGFKIGIALVLTLAIFAVFNDIEKLNIF